ncbi:UNKNOWN [Stylonychia lemnae]|uniref:PHD-type domain-containing protein n=1 Tax=Stylonychia lemnae TaxID=5949 RepID=A0A078AYK3_STYLE|nr:UNKNOWN [Stylonychia lemnae]|eukprot:CDW87500.1 UNKNOWN [Stylonychia lemnae]
MEAHSHSQKVIMIGKIVNLKFTITRKGSRRATLTRFECQAMKQPQISQKMPAIYKQNIPNSLNKCSICSIESQTYDNMIVQCQTCFSFIHWKCFNRGQSSDVQMVSHYQSCERCSYYNLSSTRDYLNPNPVQFDKIFNLNSNINNQSQSNSSNNQLVVSNNFNEEGSLTSDQNTQSSSFDRTITEHSQQSQDRGEIVGKYKSRSPRASSRRKKNRQIVLDDGLLSPLDLKDKQLCRMIRNYIQEIIEIINRVKDIHQTVECFDGLIEELNKKQAQQSQIQDQSQIEQSKDSNQNQIVEVSKYFVAQELASILNIDKQAKYTWDQIQEAVVNYCQISNVFDKLTNTILINKSQPLLSLLRGKSSFQLYSLPLSALQNYFQIFLSPATLTNDLQLELLDNDSSLQIVDDNSAKQQQDKKQKTLIFTQLGQWIQLFIQDIFNQIDINYQNEIIQGQFTSQQQSLKFQQIIAIKGILTDIVQDFLLIQ